LESHRRHGEKIHAADGFSMILQKGQPLLAGVAAPHDSSQVARHRSFRKLDAEFEQFAVDAGRSPFGILCRQTPNERARLLRHFGPPSAANRSPTPIAPETSAMPAHHGLGLHDEQCIPPSGPKPAQASPE